MKENSNNTTTENNTNEQPEVTTKKKKKRKKNKGVPLERVLIRVRWARLTAKQRKKLFVWSIAFLVIGLTYLTVTGLYLYKDKTAEDTYWEEGLKDDPVALKKANQYSKNATKVTAGTYLENVREINVKSSYFRAVFTVWFRWEGDNKLDLANNFRVYNGVINQKVVINDIHKGNTHYQELRVDATIQKNYWIVRFPLNSYQLRIFLEPTYSVDRMVFVPDKKHSVANSDFTVTGFNLTRTAVSTFTYDYGNSLNDPDLKIPIKSELCTSIEVNRGGFGLYVKCFIALFGTITWIFIVMFLATYHRVDPLGMIPAALFGTVTNISVGASLLPDSLDPGLLEFVNIAGIMIILAGALTVVNVNRIRNKDQDTNFAFMFGRTLFFILLSVVLIGAVVYPLTAYRF